MVWAGNAISGCQFYPEEKLYFPAAWKLLCTVFIMVAVGFSGGAVFCWHFFRTFSVPGVLSTKSPISSEFELRGLLCWSGAAVSKGAAKAVREIRGRAPMPDLLALASRPLAVANPRVDGAIKLVGKIRVRYEGESSKWRCCGTCSLCHLTCEASHHQWKWLRALHL